eukprot:9488087-Pyramimonas_sp.AAC.2
MDHGSPYSLIGDIRLAKNLYVQRLLLVCLLTSDERALGKMQTLALHYTTGKELGRGQFGVSVFTTKH